MCAHWAARFHGEEKVSGRLAALVLILTLSACAKPKYETVVVDRGNTGNEKVGACEVRLKVAQYCILWAWEKVPTAKESGILMIKIVRSNFLDDSAIPVDIAKNPEVVLWMPSMGHGSTPTKVFKADVGSYQVQDVFFIMPGEWQIRVQLKNGEVIEDEAILPFTL